MSEKKNSSSLFDSIKSYLRPARAPDAILTTPSPLQTIMHRRFLTDNPIAYKNAIDAAKSYVSKLDGNVSWLHSKPFDPAPGNPQYFRLMFDLLNILQAMQLPIHARILEVGSGPGWVTEILLMLGFSVDALEPSDDLIRIAQERCAGLKAHYRHSDHPNVRFHQSTLEEIEFDDNSFDAVLYFDVLHHVVNEEIAMEKSFRFLKPGGCIGVVESAWHPDFKALEAGLTAEMAEFGTLENPFSTHYVDHLLLNAGFIDIRRYVGVNGFFTASQLNLPLHHFSASPMNGSNNITARKPFSEENPYPLCTNVNYKTDARFTWIKGGIDKATRTASLVVKFENTGETRFENNPTQVGHITFSLRQGKPGSKTFLECGERILLSEALNPGKAVQLQLFFALPPDATLEHWELDAVSETAFWFSDREIKSCPVPCL